MGYLISIGFYVGLFYGNFWNARSFPFLSPLMFSETSTSQKYVTYNQTAILDKQWQVYEPALKAQGLPYLTTAHAFGMIARNIGIMATVSHMIIWHWQDIKSAFQIISAEQFKKFFKPWTWDLRFWRHEEKHYTDEEADAICPHFRLMQAYKEVPSWWFAAVWIISATVGLVTSTIAESTLPWWAFFLAVAISAFSLTFFAALTAMFGFHLLVQPLIQMIGAYIVPGRPIANMYVQSRSSRLCILTNMRLGTSLPLGSTVFTRQSTCLKT
jgi:OPT oligopeptide transporter protein